MDNWVHYKTRNPRPLDGYLIEGFYADFFKMEYEGEVCTMGRFYLAGDELYRAWGFESDEHCSFNAVALKDGSFTQSIPGCPDVHFEPGEGSEGIIVVNTQNESFFNHVTVTSKI